MVYRGAAWRVCAADAGGAHERVPEEMLLEEGAASALSDVPVRHAEDHAPASKRTRDPGRDGAYWDEASDDALLGDDICLL